MKELLLKINQFFDVPVVREILRRYRTSVGQQDWYLYAAAIP